MQTRTGAEIIMSLLECDYSDLDKLDVLYEEVAGEIYTEDEKIDLLRKAVIEHGGLTTIFEDLYTKITKQVGYEVDKLIKEYKEKLEYSELADCVETMNGQSTPLTNEQIRFIEAQNKELKNSSPDCFGHIHYFRNDLDQIFMCYGTVSDNVWNLISYWLKNQAQEKKEVVETQA